MKLEKAIAQLTEQGVQEILNETEAGLHKVVSDAEASIIQATKERDANPEYQKAKQACKDLSEGLRDVKKYQKAKSTIALAVLQERNDPDALSEDERQDLQIARDNISKSKKSDRATDVLAALQTVGVDRVQINDQPPVTLPKKAKRAKPLNQCTTGDDDGEAA